MESDSLYKLLNIKTNSFIIATDQVIEQDIALDYQCMIKFHLPITPLQCTKCDSLICQKCFEDLKTNKCPNCLKNLTTKEPSRLVRNTLNSLNLRCLNMECKLQIKYENYIEHYLICKFTPRKAKCTGCSKIIKTNNRLIEIIEHNKNCNFKENCKFCKKVFFAKDIENHMNACPDRETICPMCYEKLKLDKYSEHLLKQCIWNQILFKDQKITQLATLLSDRDKVESDLKAVIFEYEEKVDELDAKIALLNKELKENERTIELANSIIRNKDNDIAELKEQLSNKDKIISDLSRKLGDMSFIEDMKYDL
jgi:uncharacterized coiled-coil protein SlyX